MRSLGDQLSSHMSSGQTIQDLSERWRARFGEKAESWSPEEIKEKLKLCFSDNADGIRFFFDELERATALLDLLEVPKDKRMDLFELADRLVEAGGQERARVLVDATQWQAIESVPELFLQELKRTLVDNAPLKPCHLLLTEAQKSALPSSFSKLESAVRLDVVEDHEEAWDKFIRTSPQDVLVLSTRRFDPVERWVAARFHKNKLMLEPAEGLRQFAREGKLPSLPPVTHSLAELYGGRPTPTVKLPGNPLELRKLMFALRSEEGAAKLKLGPEVRLACAKILKLDVTSLPQERLDIKLKTVKEALNMTVTHATKESLENILADAREKFVPPTALEVDGELHLVNPNQEQREAAPKGTVVHTIKTAPPPVLRLLEEIDGWTEDDFAQDPGLLHAIYRLDPIGKARLGFLHARACLIWTDALSLKPGKPHLDWRGGLAKLLEGNPPPAALRLTGSHNRDKYKGWTQPVMFLAGEADPIQDCPDEVGQTFRHLTSDGQRLLSILPALCGISVERKDKVTVNSYHKKWYGEFIGGLTYREPPPPSLMIPKDAEQVRNPELWLELFNNSSALHPTADKTWAAPKGHRFELLKGLEYWQTTSFEIPGETWKDADVELALAWMALKHAASEGTATRLHDGRILVPMGSGIFAKVHLWESGMIESSLEEETRVHASLDVVCEMAFSGKPEAQLLELRSPVKTHLATTDTSIGKVTTALGYSLPRMIHLSGHGIHANISFLASPFFMGEAKTAVGAAAVAGAVEAVEDQLRIEKAQKLDLVTFEDD